MQSPRAARVSKAGQQQLHRFGASREEPVPSTGTADVEKRQGSSGPRILIPACQSPHGSLAASKEPTSSPSRSLLSRNWTFAANFCRKRLFSSTSCILVGQQPQDPTGHSLMQNVLLKQNGVLPLSSILLTSHASMDHYLPRQNIVPLRVLPFCFAVFFWFRGGTRIL